jgi:hypothetical protein
MESNDDFSSPFADFGVDVYNPIENEKMGKNWEPAPGTIYPYHDVYDDPSIGPLRAGPAREKLLSNFPDLHATEPMAIAPMTGAPILTAGNPAPIELDMGALSQFQLLVLIVFIFLLLLVFVQQQQLGQLYAIMDRIGKN